MIDWNITATRLNAKAFTVALSVPEERLRAVRALIDPLVEKAVPWNEAKEALSQALRTASGDRQQ